MQKNKTSTKKSDLTIILPVRNEGINISIMLKILNAVINHRHEILIVYDKKTDTTIPEILKLKKTNKNIYPIHNNEGKGIINAIKAGVKKSNSKYILILAVDDVGPVLAIDDMIYLLKSGCDFISCTRYKYGGRRLGGSLVESVFSRLGNKLFNLVAGSKLSDATTGFKMFKKELFHTLNLESNPVGWAVVFEMVIKAQILGYKLGEVPIISIDRLYGGKSSFRFKPWLKEYLRWFLYGIKNRKKIKQNNNIVTRIPKSNIS